MLTQEDKNSKYNIMEGLEKGLSKLRLENQDLSEKKQHVRCQVWSLMQQDGKLNPYPPECKFKIPNFRGASRASYKTSNLRELRRAKVIKVNPSLAQMKLRQRILEAGKTLIVPAPSLSVKDPNGGGEFMFKVEGQRFASEAASKKGAKKYGVPLLLDNWNGLKIDLYVVGSVAVSAQGVRLGKGLGYAEMEWAILVELGVVDPEKTVVVTTVHEDQIVANDELSKDEFMEAHDLPVDIIVTPSRIINVRPRLAKPSVGIIWDKITPEKLNECPILERFKRYSKKEHPKQS